MCITTEIVICKERKRGNATHREHEEAESAGNELDVVDSALYHYPPECDLIPTDDSWTKP